MTLEEEILAVVNQIIPTIEKAFMDAMVLRHPGHGNQKTHGNRFGAGQAKESLRRLKDDKGAREQYKQRFRKQQADKKASAQWWDDFMAGRVEAPKARTVKPKATQKPSAPKSNYHKKYAPKPQKVLNPLASDYSAAASLDASGGGKGAADRMARRKLNK